MLDSSRTIMSVYCVRHGHNRLNAGQETNDCGHHICGMLLRRSCSSRALDSLANRQGLQEADMLRGNMSVHGLQIATITDRSYGAQFQQLAPTVTLGWICGRLRSSV